MYRKIKSKDMKKIRHLLFILTVLSVKVNTVFAFSDSVFVLPDTVKPFTLENFYTVILANHPVAKQAYLLSDFAKQEIRLARGNFDPKLELQYLKKEYENNEYYNKFNAGIKFPSVLPFDPAIGLEKNSGSYLNPEQYIADEYNYKQFYAGISLPLGRGLITDERRAALRQAELFQGMTEAEQIKLINKLLLEAAKDYWQWYYTYYNYRLINKGVTVASIIFNLVKTNYELGEAAQVDTIQAKITLQQRQIEQNEAWMDFQNTGIRLSTYLWDSLNNPLLLDASWAPVRQADLTILSEGDLLHLVETAKENHPDLKKLTIKLQQLEVERKLAAEFIKPKLDLSYYFLNQPVAPNWSTTLSVGENYKLGVDFNFPLFIRKERAKLAQAKLKINSTTYERSMAERQIINEISTTFNSLTNTSIILQQQNAMMENYDKLLKAELLNLENGESDLFKINVQLEKLIQSQSKMVKLTSEVEKQKALLYWASGVRNLGK
jgi:outer membrane protein TolC